jgi:AraC family transcriptional regulator
MSEIESTPVNWLFHGPLLGLSVWEGAPTGEPVQAWPAVSFIHSGAFLLHAQGRSAVIDATSVLLQNPGERLLSEHPFGGRENGSTIYIHPEMLLALLSVHDPTVGDRPEFPFPRPYLQGLFRAELLQRLLVGRLRGDEPTEALAIEEAILKVLGEVARECRPSPGSPAARRHPSRARRVYVEDAKALLQRRFRERLQLDDIARALFVSPYHLCRLFREETGVTIHRYLNRLRLREALGPIAGGPVELGELALTLGFSSHSHFTAAFRKEFGLSPRRVKQLSTLQVSDMVRSLGL